MCNVHVEQTTQYPPNMCGDSFNILFRALLSGRSRTLADVRYWLIAHSSYPGTGMGGGGVGAGVIGLMSFCTAYLGPEQSVRTRHAHNFGGDEIDTQISQETFENRENS